MWGLAGCGATLAARRAGSAGLVSEDHQITSGHGVPTPRNQPAGLTGLIAFIAILAVMRAPPVGRQFRPVWVAFVDTHINNLPSRGRLDFQDDVDEKRCAARLDFASPSPPSRICSLPAAGRTSGRRECNQPILHGTRRFFAFVVPSARLSLTPAAGMG